MQVAPLGEAAAQFEKLPLATTCRRLDFDYVAIEAQPRNVGALLVVGGIKNWLNLVVELRPRCHPAYPEFWVIEVVAVLPGFAVRGDVDFHIVLPLAGCVGTQGIEIVGATKAERRWLPFGRSVNDVEGGREETDNDQRSH
ncbi:MAG: hypothetical protein ABI190_00280 [Casimicrobiaceae bacterium]